MSRLNPLAFSRMETDNELRARVSEQNQAMGCPVKRADLESAFGHTLDYVAELIDVYRRIIWP